MQLKLYNLIESTEVLGPYNRFAIWTQGCPFSCMSCMTPNSQSLEGGKDYNIFQLADMIINNIKIEGLTITGGEPFIQIEALIILLKKVKEKRDIGVIVYSGYTLEEINYSETKQELLKYIDILIDGKYIDSLNDDISLRGSSNQNIYQLTNRYSKIFEQYYNIRQRNIELYLNKTELMVAGIPKQERLDKFRERGVIA